MTWSPATPRRGAGLKHTSLLTEVGIALAEPIRARRMEDVEIDCVFKCFSLVRHIGRNSEHLARANDNFFSIDRKLQRTLKNVAQLFIHVTVQGNDASLF